MSLFGLLLRHGRRGGCAAPEPAAVAGATPLFWCLVWHVEGWDVHFPSHPPLGGRSGRNRSFAGRRPDRTGQARPDNGREAGNTAMVASASHDDASQPDGRAVGASGIHRLKAVPNGPSRKGLLAGSDPMGRGQGCANTPGPEPAAGLWTAGSLPPPSECSEWHWPHGVRGLKTFACRSFRRRASVHRRSAEVCIGMPCRLRTPVRLWDVNRSLVARPAERTIRPASRLFAARLGNRGERTDAALVLGVVVFRTSPSTHP